MVSDQVPSLRNVRTVPSAEILLFSWRAIVFPFYELENMLDDTICKYPKPDGFLTKYYLRYLLND